MRLYFHLKDFYLILGLLESISFLTLFLLYQVVFASPELLVSGDQT